MQLRAEFWARKNANNAESVPWTDRLDAADHEAVDLFHFSRKESVDITDTLWKEEEGAAQVLRDDGSSCRGI